MLLVLKGENFYDRCQGIGNCWGRFFFLLFFIFTPKTNTRLSLARTVISLNLSFCEGCGGGE